MFGAYDHTNDNIHVQCSKRKTGKQFVDFLESIEGMIRTSRTSFLYWIIFQHRNQRW
ncbi:MAG TPA: hypothetical protein VIY08_04540 [Candidatus Nitrosocosmicus sp.]